ncbi:MAG: thiaminase II, partial [Gemmatimonadetes bacterium]|nr:thiaminase II [Gemmatimonadota bacterium]
MALHRSGGPFSEELRARFADDWRRAHEDHPFVLAMGDGTLPLERFQLFMRQDYLYLIDFCRVLALACAKSPDLESMGRWAKLLDETLNSEMALHRGFCADFGISRRDLERTEPAPATAAYTHYLLETAREGGIEEIAASLLPCQWGYDEIGRRLAAQGKAPPDSFHARWIAAYNAPEYRAVTDWLRALVDRLGAAAAPETRRRMAEAFKAG